MESFVETGLLEKVKIKHTNYYMNVRLIELFMNHQMLVAKRNDVVIESVSSNR